MEHVQFHENGIKEAGTHTPTLAIDADGGKIIAYVGSDIDCYSEVFIDFVTDDGRVMQLACIGQRHEECSEPSMHGDVWDGVHEFSAFNHEIEVSENSYWYDY